MEESSELAGFLLLELVESMGGFATLDATRVRNLIKNGSDKLVTMRYISNKKEILLEVIDEDQD